MLNKMDSNNNMYGSKPPIFEGKGGSAYVVWDVKFRSWAGIKGIWGRLLKALKGSYPLRKIVYWMILTLHRRPSGLPESKKIAVAMDALVQCMSDTDNFHCILQSMNKDADWPTGKAWKTRKIIQEHYQPKDSTSTRDLLSALQKIKLKKMPTQWKYCLT